MDRLNNIDNAIRFCYKNEVSFDQFIFLYLLKTIKKDGKDNMMKYIETFGMFGSKDTLSPLEEKGLLENMNSPGKYYPDMFMLTPKADKFFANHEISADFWYAYPGTLPIGGGKMFISRSGIDIDEFSALYLKAIDYSQEVHLEVMKSLPKFTRMVEEGTLNGKKIVDFIKERVWESLPDDDNDDGEWGTDV